MKYIVDTHALLWYVQNDSRLGQTAKSILTNPTGELLLPATVVAEAVWIIESGKTSIPSPEVLLGSIDLDLRFRFVALTREIIDASISLTQIRETHDRQIVASALICGRNSEIRIVTVDKGITAFSGVRSVW